MKRARRQERCWTEGCDKWATPRRLWCAGCGASFYRWAAMTEAQKRASVERAERRVGRVTSFRHKPWRKARKEAA